MGAKRDGTLRVVASVALWLGCAGDAPAPEATALEPPEIVCSEPRGEICTFEYNPVCALRDTGVRCVQAPCPSFEWKTYSNPCTACADPQVAGYRHDACEAE